MDVKERYHKGADFQFEHEEITLGAPTSYSLTHDPKHVGFVYARYKFVAKMLADKKIVLEIGCGDGIGIPIMAKQSERLYCIEWEERPLKSIERRLLKHFPNVTLLLLDVTEKAPEVRVDAAYSIDVLEHIDPAKEDAFMRNVVRSLPPDGVLVTGTPNVSAAQYASTCSAIQHINLKSQDELKSLMGKYFHNTFMFGMNDEVIHTGYGPMCHYIWSVAVGPRKIT